MVGAPRIVIDKATLAAAVAHYDHHYGDGAWETLTPRAQHRLALRMRAAIAVYLMAKHGNV